MWQSAEDGEKGIDEDEKDSFPSVVASLAHELISCLARCRYPLDRCQHTRLKVYSNLLHNFKSTMNFQS